MLEDCLGRAVKENCPEMALFEDFPRRAVLEDCFFEMVFTFYVSCCQMQKLSKTQLFTRFLGPLQKITDICIFLSNMHPEHIVNSGIFSHVKAEQQKTLVLAVLRESSQKNTSCF